MKVVIKEGTPDNLIIPDVRNPAPVDLSTFFFDRISVVHIQEVKGNERLDIQACSVVWDADNSLYETEEGLYASDKASYAIAMRSFLKDHAAFREICNDDAHWKEFWDSVHQDENGSGRTFRDCMGRGLKGDVVEFKKFLELHIAGRSKDPEKDEVAASREGAFDIDDFLLEELIKRIQDDPDKFSEMLKNCRPVPFVGELLLSIHDQRIPMVVSSATSQNNVERCLAYFEVTGPEGVSAGQMKEFFKDVKGDVVKVKQTEGGPVWVSVGVGKTIDTARTTTSSDEKHPLASHSRAGVVMFGDSMSDVGPALLNGIGAVIIRVPPGPNRAGAVKSLKEKVTRLITNQSAEVAANSALSSGQPQLHIVECWSQVRFSGTPKNPFQDCSTQVHSS